MTSFYYYDQNPSGFCFREQIRSFVIFAGITEFEYERKNGKDSGRSKMTPLCKHKTLFPCYCINLQNSPYVRASSQTKGLERGWKRGARSRACEARRFARVRLLSCTQVILRREKKRLFCSLVGYCTERTNQCNGLGGENIPAPRPIMGFGTE